MKSLLNGLLLVALMAVVAAPSFAGDDKAKADKAKAAAKKDGEKKDGEKKDGEKKKKPREGAKKRDPAETLAAGVLRRLGKVELTVEQQEEIKKLAATYSPKLIEARKKGNLTREQQQARQAAMKKAKADGLARKEAQAAVAAAASLSEEQQAAMAATRKIQAEFNKAAMAVLTEDQRKQVNANRPKRDGKKEPKRKKEEA